MPIVTADLNDSRHQHAILALLDMYARDPMGNNAPLPPRTHTELINGLQQQSNVLVLIAYEADLPVGLLIGFQGFSTFQARPLLNIHDLAVDPSARGRGFARQLMQEAERIARERGYGQVTLEVREDNTTAQKLYQSEGFNECEPRMWFWKKQL